MAAMGWDRFTLLNPPHIERQMVEKCPSCSVSPPTPARVGNRAVVAIILELASCRRMYRIYSEILFPQSPSTRKVEFS